MSNTMNSWSQQDLDAAFAEDLTNALVPLCDKYTKLISPPEGTPTILALTSITHLPPLLRHMFFNQLDNASADLAQSIINTLDQVRGSDKA